MLHVLLLPSHHCGDATCPPAGHCLAWGRSLLCIIPQRPRVPSKHLGWCQGTKHQSWAQCRKRLFVTLWTTQTWRARFTKGIHMPHHGAQTSMKKSSCFGGGIWTAQLQNPCKMDKVPSKSGVVGFSTKEGSYTPQGCLLCSGINEKWMISANACTWGPAKSVQRTEAVSASLWEALQTTGATQCSPHLGLKQCQTKAMEQQHWRDSQDICALLPPPNTSSGHGFCHFHWGELSLTLATAPQTFTLTDSKQHEQFELAGEGKKYLVFPLLHTSSSACALSIAKPWEPNLPSHSSPYKHQFWSHGNSTAAALWSPGIFLSATGHHKCHQALQVTDTIPRPCKSS